MEIPSQSDTLSIVRPNRTAELLHASRCAFGTLSLLHEPALPEIAGAVGFDHFVIDTEHAAAGEDRVRGMIRACEAGGITPIVRVRTTDEKELLWVLDSGAQGLLLPLVENPEQVRELVRLTHYPPVGERTLCSGSRTLRHGVGRSSLRPHLDQVNDQLILIGLIETPEGVANAEELARAGMDAVLVGRSDLSLKLGLGYAPWDDRVTEATEEVIAKVTSAGKVAGVLAYDLADAEWWMRKGCRLVIYTQPEFILSEGYSRGINGLRELEAAVLAEPSVSARA